MLPRIYTETAIWRQHEHIKHKGDITSQDEIILGSDASNHLLRVLRLPVGAEVIVFDGNGGEYLATIVSTHKKNARLRIKEYIPVTRESCAKIHLGQAIPKGEKMDFIIQKATELGVTSITPLFTNRCNINLDEPRLKKKTEHWHRVAISAAEQCGRTFIPVINKAENLKNWVENSPSIKMGLTLAPSAAVNFTRLLAKCGTVVGEIYLLIGPEGGLTMEEIEFTLSKNFCAANLGKRILRTETAALTAISILQASWGDL